MAVVRSLLRLVRSPSCTRFVLFFPSLCPWYNVPAAVAMQFRPILLLPEQLCQCALLALAHGGRLLDAPLGETSLFCLLKVK